MLKIQMLEQIVTSDSVAEQQKQEEHDQQQLQQQEEQNGYELIFSNFYFTYFEMVSLTETVILSHTSSSD